MNYTKLKFSAFTKVTQFSTKFSSFS